MFWMESPAQSPGTSPALARQALGGAGLMSLLLEAGLGFLKDQLFTERKAANSDLWRNPHIPQIREERNYLSITGDNRFLTSFKITERF